MTPQISTFPCMDSLLLITSGLPGKAHSTSISSGGKMIPGGFLGGFHKKIPGRAWPSRVLTAFFHRERTFCPIFRHKKPPCGGDVIPGPRRFFAGYANRYAPGEGCGKHFQTAAIPVDNMEFSTFSTSFSTGVDNCGNVLGIYTGDLHNREEAVFTNCSLFRVS